MVKANRETWVYAASLAAMLAVSLITSLFFKADWLWMDEVLSYRFISDPSLSHMNDAVVSGMDANPPFFPNLYWLIGQISLHPQFLRAVSVVFFATSMAVFYRYTTQLIAAPRSNLVLITLISALTYLNFTLSTQIRAYSIFLLISCGYFIVVHQLACTPRRTSLLVAHVGVGVLLVLVHNFGLFYLAASGVFFALMLFWSRDRNYLRVWLTHGLIVVAWLLLWSRFFAIQTEAGKPHSWIPLPTFSSFFYTAGELVPSLSSQLERRPSLSFLPVLRFAAVLGLFLFLALPRLKRGFKETIADQAFVFYLLSGFVYFSTMAIAVTVSFAHTSVFISRYLWPSHLLLIFQLLYAYHHFAKGWSFPRLRIWIPVYLAAAGAFIFYQNRKIVVFPSRIVDYLPKLSPAYPVFVETADYFLPIWFHRKDIPVHYLLDWESASRPGNLLSTTVEHKILQSFAEKYNVPTIVPIARFTGAAFPHFYLVHEDVIYGMKRLIETGRIRVVRELPIAIKGQHLLECAFQSSPSLAGLPSP
jgi:hypothetical protein